VAVGLDVTHTLALFYERLPCSESGLTRRSRFRLGRRIAQLLQNTSSALWTAIDQDLGGFAQGIAPKVSGHPIPFHPVEKGGDLQQFRAYRDKPSIDNRLYVAL